jgi:hypothetical protein
MSNNVQNEIKSNTNTRLRTFLTYTPAIDDDPEINNEPSLTVPDMALTIQDIMARHIQGKPLPTAPNLQYQSDDPDNSPLLPNVATLDLTDQQEMLYETYHNIAEGKKKLSEQQAAKKRKKAEDKVKADERKQRESEDNTTLPSADKT